MDVVRHDLYGFQRPAVLCAGLFQYRLRLHLDSTCEYGMPVLCAPDDVVLERGNRIAVASCHRALYDCRMRRSVTVFPELSDKEVSSVIETRKQYAKAFNMSVDCLISNSSTSKRFLHKVQYERIKEECPTLPTGLIQCARDVAVEAVKTWNVEEDEAEAETS